MFVNGAIFLRACLLMNVRCLYHVDAHVSLKMITPSKLKKESHELAAIVFCAAMLVVLLEWTIVLNSCGGS